MIESTDILAAVDDLLPSLAQGEPVLWDCGSREIAQAMNEAMHVQLTAHGIRVRHDSGIIDMGGGHYMQTLNLAKPHVKALIAQRPVTH